MFQIGLLWPLMEAHLRRSPSGPVYCKHESNMAPGSEGEGLAEESYEDPAQVGDCWSVKLLLCIIMSVPDLWEWCGDDMKNRNTFPEKGNMVVFY